MPDTINIKAALAGCVADWLRSPASRENENGLQRVRDGGDRRGERAV